MRYPGVGAIAVPKDMTRTLPLPNRLGASLLGGGILKVNGCCRGIISLVREASQWQTSVL
jgi:hypothetical protein